MTGLIKRNLKLYFSNKSGVFFSLLGALISFVLYLVFLRHSMEQSWESVNGSKQLLDSWLMGGTLTVTAITTTANALGLMVKDRESKRIADLVLTDQSYSAIHVAYLFSAWLIGIVMQLLMLIIMQVFFMLTDNIKLNYAVLPLLGVIVFSSLLWSTFNLVLLSFVKKEDTLGKINTIIGTAAGFFAGVYMPIGMLPKFAKSLMELTPAPYNAALFRQVMMDKSFNSVPTNMLADFKTNLGVIINKGNDINILIFALVILGILILPLYRYNKRIVVNKI